MIGFTGIVFEFADGIIQLHHCSWLELLQSDPTNQWISLLWRLFCILHCIAFVSYIISTFTWNCCATASKRKPLSDYTGSPRIVINCQYCGTPHDVFPHRLIRLQSENGAIQPASNRSTTAQQFSLASASLCVGNEHVSDSDSDVEASSIPFQCVASECNQLNNVDLHDLLNNQRSTDKPLPVPVSRGYSLQRLKSAPKLSSMRSSTDSIAPPSVPSLCNSCLDQQAFNLAHQRAEAERVTERRLIEAVGVLVQPLFPKPKTVGSRISSLQFDTDPRLTSIECISTFLNSGLVPIDWTESIISHISGSPLSQVLTMSAAFDDKLCPNCERNLKVLNKQTELYCVNVQRGKNGGSVNSPRVSVVSNALLSKVLSDFESPSLQSDLGLKRSEHLLQSRTSLGHTTNGPTPRGRSRLVPGPLALTTPDAHGQEHSQPRGSTGPRQRSITRAFMAPSLHNLQFDQDSLDISDSDPKNLTTNSAAKRGYALTRESAQIVTELLQFHDNQRGFKNLKSCYQTGRRFFEDSILFLDTFLVYSVFFTIAMLLWPFVVVLRHFQLISPEHSLDVVSGPSSSLSYDILADTATLASHAYVPGISPKIPIDLAQISGLMQQRFNTFLSQNISQWDGLEQYQHQLESIFTAQFGDTTWIKSPSNPVVHSSSNRLHDHDLTRIPQPVQESILRHAFIPRDTITFSTDLRLSQINSIFPYQALTRQISVLAPYQHAKCIVVCVFLWFLLEMLLYHPVILNLQIDTDILHAIIDISRSDDDAYRYIAYFFLSKLLFVGILFTFGALIVLLSFHTIISLISLQIPRLLSVVWRSLLSGSSNAAVSKAISPVVQNRRDLTSNVDKNFAPSDNSCASALACEFLVQSAPNDESNMFFTPSLTARQAPLSTLAVSIIPPINASNDVQLVPINSPQNDQFPLNPVSADHASHVPWWQSDTLLAIPSTSYAIASSSVNLSESLANSRQSVYRGHNPIVQLTPTASSHISPRYIQSNSMSDEISGCNHAPEMNSQFGEHHHAMNNSNLMFPLYRR